MNRSHRCAAALSFLLLLCTALPPALAQGPAGGKIEPALLDSLAAAGQSDFVLRFTEQADLSPAYALGWSERGEFVVQALRAAAARSQARAQAYLDAHGLACRTFIAGNELYVRAGDLAAAQALAALGEVESIRRPRTYYLDPVLEPSLAGQGGRSAATAWGLTDTHADQFWSAFAHQGEGIVVANIDTGVQWDHPALDQAYRCPDNPGDPACWEDPSDVCGGTPCDNAGHGTHTMGTMVADDDPSLAYIAGMAPGARWIACKGCEGWSCSEYALDACADWLLQPGGDPANRPHVVNNSWGGASCEDWYLPKVQAWRAAGIFPAFSAGNGGSSCGSVRSPGDYQESFASAAHSASRAIASFSSRGPSCAGHDPYTKPNLSAPGVSVCSSVPGGGFSCGWSGTSMASPHTAGAVALLWSCQPALVGQVEATFRALQEAADPPPAGNCGAPPDGQGNYTYGYGYLDVYAAGLAWCGGAGGRLEGHVRQAGTGDPIAGALVVAARQDGRTFAYRTDPAGYYSADALVGTYTLAGHAYGYASATVPAVAVITDTLTTVDLELDAIPSFVISGTVVDGAAGWPLYAEVTIRGNPVDPPPTAGSRWTDPLTGFFSATLAGAITYTVQATAWAPAYRPASAVVLPLTGNRSVSLSVPADADSCLAPGYRPDCPYFENFEAGDGGYTPTGVSSWEWGTPASGPGSAHSGRRLWATNLDGNYRSDEDGAVESPPIDLGALAGQGLLLSWWQYLWTESGADYASVEVSRDGGSTWTRAYGEVSGFVDRRWTHRQAVLDPSFAVAGFRLRFRLRSAGTATYAGYYVDDICIRPLGPPLASLSDDFEAGYGHWSMGGLWNAEAEGDACGAQAAPFPSSSHAAYYGRDDICTYDTGMTNSGTLSMTFDLDLGGAGAAGLSFHSYEETACGGGNCASDRRYLDLSTDGGASWTAVWGSTGPEQAWHGTAVDLSAYAGGPLRVRFRFETDAPANDHLGWLVDDVRLAGYPSPTATPCLPQPGGLVVGHVYDANSGAPRGGAAVASDAGGWSVVSSTPDDPAVEDALFTIYVPTGTHVLTATMPRRYGPAVASVAAAPGGALAQDLYLPAGLLQAAPAGLSVTLGWGMSTTLPLTLANSGALELAYDLAEVQERWTPALRGAAASGGTPDLSPREAGAAGALSAGPAPQWFLGTKGTRSTLLPLAGAPAYAMDLSSTNLVRFETESPDTWEAIARLYGSAFTAGDMIVGDFRTLYAIDYYRDLLYAVDTGSGAANLIGPLMPYHGESWTGMAGAPDGTMYACSTSLAHSTLYTLDLATGEPTVVGEIDGAPCVIDIAVDAAGRMYGLDICADVLVEIDPASGAAATIGPIGFNANYAQDMDFEEGTGRLYLAAYNLTANQGELRIADPATGSSVLVGAFPGGHEVDAMGFAVGGTADVPWLRAAPLSGTLPVGGNRAVTVAFEAGQVRQPGTYGAALYARHDTPSPPLRIPVTMTVRPAATMGKVGGIVSDARSGLPLEAGIAIRGGDPITQTASAPGSGYWQVWLVAGAYELVVSATGHLSQTVAVEIAAGQTTRRDIALEPYWHIYLPLAFRE